MRITRRICISCAALLPAAVAAQAFRVVPEIAATADGDFGSSFPFSAAPARSQQIWAGSAISTGVATLTAVDYRLDFGAPAPAIIQRSFTMTLDHTQVTPAGMLADFAGNRGVAPLTVFAADLSLPAYAPPPPQQSLTAPWSIRVPFARPFTFDPATGNLLAEYVTTSRTGGFDLYSIDAHSRGGTALPVGVGNGLPFVGLEPVDLKQLVPGGTLAIDLSSRFTPPAALAIGASNRRWGNLNLPLNLVPFGGNGVLYISADIILGVAWDSFHRSFISRLRTPVPAEPTLASTVLFAQALALTPGLVTSDAYALAIAPDSATTTNLIYERASRPGTVLHLIPGTPTGPVTRFAGTFR